MNPQPTDHAHSRIDIHSHLLPGIDDGCASLDESLESVRRLIAAGYRGSICTPHIWPEKYAGNKTGHIEAWTKQLQLQIWDTGLDYQVWPGGELRLFEGTIDWMKQRGVPTLAGSRCVLLDYWGNDWPKWTNECFRWLLDEGYQPILAHPERLTPSPILDTQLGEIAILGVWLQGNFACMTGQEGYYADQRVRQFLSEGRYHFMALDMHGPDTIKDRLDGLDLVEKEFGLAMLDRFTIEAPHSHILKVAQ